MLIVGIDPGKKGAICEYYEDQDIIKFYPMDIDIFIDLVKKWRTEMPHVYLEKAQAMPTQGVRSMFNYGRHYGMLEGILLGASINYEAVAPQTWTSVMTRDYLGETGKERALEAVKFLFPDVNLLATKRSKKPHDGFVDALLIAEYGKRRIENEQKEIL